MFIAVNEAVQRTFGLRLTIQIPISKWIIVNIFKTIYPGWYMRNDRKGSNVKLGWKKNCEKGFQVSM